MNPRQVGARLIFAGAIGEILYRFHDEFRQEESPDVDALSVEDRGLQWRGELPSEGAPIFAIVRDRLVGASCRTGSIDGNIAFASTRHDYVPNPERYLAELQQVVAAWATSMLAAGRVPVWWIVNDCAYWPELEAAKRLGASRLYEGVQVDASDPRAGR